MGFRPIYINRYRGKFFSIYSWFVIFGLLFNLGFFVVQTYLDFSFFNFGNFFLYVGPSFINALIYLIFRFYINSKDRVLDLKKWQEYAINILYISSIYTFVFLYRHLFVLYCLPIFLILASTIFLDKEKIKTGTHIFMGLNLMVALILIAFFNFAPSTLIDFVLSSFVLFLMQKFSEILIDYMIELSSEVDKINKRQEILNNNLHKAIGDLKIEPMTKLFNKRAMNEALASKISNFAKTGKTAYVVILDLDHFKSINDTYGHDVGDKVLLALADMLKTKVDKKGSAFRFGGEEFVLLFEKYNEREVFRIVDDIRVSFGKVKFPSMPGRKITLSAGISVIKKGDTVDSWFKRADTNLYYSKEHGRNQVTSETIKGD